MELQPRSNQSRVLRMILLIAVATAVVTTLGLIDVQLRLGPLHLDIADILGFVVLATAFGYLATRVSLPWYYVGWLLVPFLGIYALWKISWRVAYLPWRDWELREGEVRGPFDVAHDFYGTRERMVPVRTD